MCYAQIGGLCIATFVTLLLLPVIYSIFVLDLKLVKWETVSEARLSGSAPESQPQSTEPITAGGAA